MPGRRRWDGERRLEAALDAINAALKRAGAPWAVIGGIAVIARGVRRMTTDIDVVVLGEAVTLDRLIRRLATSKIVPRIEAAEAFAQTNLVFLLRHSPSGVDIDLSLGWTGFERAAIRASTNAAFFRLVRASTERRVSGWSPSSSSNVIA